MYIIDIINHRHSYRGKYKPISVPREDLITIMQAGLNAPSGCNKQTTSLIAVDDKDMILSILVDTFISKISFPMQPGPEIGSISDA